MLQQRASEDVKWEVPYLPIDPADLGRNYEEVIRINSQSGKGGVAWILEQIGGYQIPKAMQPEVQKKVQKISDERAQEIEPPEIVKLFEDDFINQTSPYGLEAIQIDSSEVSSGQSQCNLGFTLARGEESWLIQGQGSGPVQALVNGLDQALGLQLEVLDYYEHALAEGAQAEAAAYLCLRDGNSVQWGAGRDENITMAGLKALISALNHIQG